ncbi:MAG TPA: hypothetical protein VH143_09910 [Kofleriaceae bacterium]|jgi:hypothetical protein|nr:hypothetical protein [Kofleriaceae bacterium]
MRITLVALLVAIVACGPGNRQAPGGDDDDSGGDGGNQMGSNGSDGCSDAAKLIYVVDKNNRLAQFNPMTKAFTTLGTVSCPSSGNPFSMAVDRSAQAYILFDDDKIYKVDTTQSSLPCTKTSWSSQDGLDEFGMGYSTDTMGGSTDTLFIAGGADLDGEGSPGPANLATLDTSSMNATVVGSINGRPELTGNANAELWGWFPDVDGSSTPLVEQIDKTTGMAVAANTYQESSLDDGEEPVAWAFGFYGGDYWVFLQLQSDFPEQSTVYQVAGPTSTTPGMIVSKTPATGLEIVGAGVSTCAPTMIF